MSCSYRASENSYRAWKPKGFAKPCSKGGFADKMSGIKWLLSQGVSEQALAASCQAELKEQEKVGVDSATEASVADVQTAVQVAAPKADAATEAAMADAPKEMHIVAPKADAAAEAAAADVPKEMQIMASKADAPADASEADDPKAESEKSKNPHGYGGQTVEWVDCRCCEAALTDCDNCSICSYCQNASFKLFRKRAIEVFKNPVTREQTDVQKERKVRIIAISSVKRAKAEGSKRIRLMDVTDLAAKIADELARRAA
mmetsp:Transcript_104546/g.184469  ORF Transcript_104546/g.184469 Transcript_104546/m.184469 type:complete len:259 (+) Transcript_104546:53-829(+)